MPPILYIKSAIRASEAGLGDGTAYASGSSAVVSQTNKTFDLSTIVKIADLPTLTDDDLNGYFLYFTTSLNRYHIVDFVASTDVVTTWEVPQTTDTGAWEIRRGVLDLKALAGNPALRLSDGQKFSNWQSAVDTVIDIHLPNLIYNGGFEEATIAPWSLVQTGGASSTSARNTTAPVLGSVDMLLDKGDRTEVYLQQKLTERLKATGIYRILFKGKYTTAFTAGDLEVAIINASDTLFSSAITFSDPSSGTVTVNSWLPELAVTNAWHFVDMAIPAGGLPKNTNIRFTIKSAGNTFNLDEVYVFEKVDVEALAVFGIDATSSTISEVRGRYCASDRTSFAAGVEDARLQGQMLFDQENDIQEFNLGFGEGAFGSGAFGEISTRPGIYPIYSIIMGSSIPLKQSSEMLLCEKWEWKHGPNRPIDFDAVEYDEKTHTARSGVQRTIKHNQRRTFAHTYFSMPEADRLVLINNWKPSHRDDLHPFVIKIKPTDAPLLMIEDGSKFSNPYNNIQPDWEFKFKEVL